MTEDTAQQVFRLLGPWPGGRPPGPDRVGAKAANLMRMAQAGLPVPPGFVLETGFCRRLQAEGQAALAGLPEILKVEIAALESATGRRLGDGRRPLLVSVRSGAARSMPGMLETVLNIGSNETAVDGLIRMTGNHRLAWDCFRRLVEQYAEVVEGLKPSVLGGALADALRAAGTEQASNLDFEQLENLTGDLLRLYHARVGTPFPRDPSVQLDRAVRAVFESWSSHKAREYRRLNNLSDDDGTAVTVQAMVFGNAGMDGGSGVGFTRDPATGEKRLFLDFKFNGQGEDVVAGRGGAFDTDRLARRLPGVRADLDRVAQQLEELFRDMQDFEFTVEGSHLYLLQARAGKRMPLAALTIAADLVTEGLITPDEALQRLADVNLDALEKLTCRPAPGTMPLAKAQPASAGVASGAAVFDAAAARRRAERGEPAILIRPTASTEDIEALALSAGLLTAEGARTSHAAVVARQLGKVCLVGCHGLRLDAGNRRGWIGDQVIEAGDPLTLDGNGGAVFAGLQPIIRERPDGLLARVAGWRRDAEKKAG